VALETPNQTPCFCLDKPKTIQDFPLTVKKSNFNSNKSYPLLRAFKIKCNCSFSPDENSGTRVGLQMVFTVLSRAIHRLSGMFISDQSELLPSLPGLLIFRHISETAYT